MTTPRLSILHVSAEMTPWAKVGGLADVVSALGKEMAASGHDSRILMPKYGSISPGDDWQATELQVYTGPVEGTTCRLWKAPFAGATVYLLEHEAAFGGPDIYWPNRDNTGRYALLCRAAIDLCHALGWFPDIMHCHDWHSGLVPVFLNTHEVGSPLHATATVFTVHNLQHQGEAPLDILDTTRLPADLTGPGGISHNGKINFMKAGLYHATKLTTVSPRYAREIQTPEYGHGLQGILHERRRDLIGILNGIDTTEWDPATDPLIPANFTATDRSGKATCKRQLQQRFGLEPSENTPVYGVIARLYGQKGLDLLADIIDRLIATMRIQIAVLGAGEVGLENAFRHAAERYPGRVGAYIGYDPALSHLVEAGSDFFIMPSRFEPCGLNQMYSMAYGTLPIVRETGGLADSVQAYDPDLGTGTGFKFVQPSGDALYETIGCACAVYYDRPDHLDMLRDNAMRQDLSWANSAQRYQDAYLWAVDTRLRGLGKIGASHTPFSMPILARK